MKHLRMRGNTKTQMRGGNMFPDWWRTPIHKGLVLSPSQRGFDRGATSMGSIFTSEDDPGIMFLFYTSASDLKWSHSAIGLATSDDGCEFSKFKSPILEGSRDCFCRAQILNPAVVRIGNLFYMIIAGTNSLGSGRGIGIAYADDPKGPWHIIGELIKPSHLWEGNAVDNSPSILKLDDETILFYYSSITSPKYYDIFSILRRYPIRRIGILKVRIRGTSLSSIEAMRFSGNPLKHLNGSKGRWNESVFCPGHIRLDDKDFLFPATSTYSVGFPYKQYIGLITSNSPYFPKNDLITKKSIDGPKQKSQIIPNPKSEIALDTPAPYFDPEKRKLFLYYSVADRADGVWKIALTTFNLTD